jgi:MFS family permease
MSERVRGVRPRLPRAVWLLSWTSLFTDTASEAVYPLMPLYLTRVLGATAFSIGLIEGLAEAVNSLLKIASGRFSDRWNRRKPFVLAGYGLSSAVRPLVAAATSWPHVLLIRLADRVGKGVRTAPRDALLTTWADPATRGYVFGLHRAMDHAGAVIGPLCAAAYLWAFPGHYRTLFLLTLIPGAAAVLMLARVPDAAPTVPAANGASPATVAAARVAGPEFRRFLGVVLLFSLGNSTDAFLLLRLSDAGVGAAWIPVAWAALHVVKMVTSPIGGHLSDRWSRKGLIASGWCVYAAVYAGFAVVDTRVGLLALFLAYGIYYGLTEGVEKAVVADLAPAEGRGAAFGLYHGLLGVGALAASLLFGAIWRLAGASWAFAVGAMLALAATALLLPLRLRRRDL